MARESWQTNSLRITDGGKGRIKNNGQWKQKRIKMSGVKELVRRASKGQNHERYDSRRHRRARNMGTRFLKAGAGFFASKQPKL